jgi:hypothetical protein
MHVRRFLRINTPKWSLKNERIEQRKQSEAYEMLKIKWNRRKQKELYPHTQYLM